MEVDIWFFILAIPVAIGLVVLMRIDLVLHFMSKDKKGRKTPKDGRRYTPPKPETPDPAVEDADDETTAAPPAPPADDADSRRD